ncbi:MAG: hypothetical protein KAI83_12020 [Thiomargarita sp.]|jgi:hypothetical protein|nr:hypothetical protein [Thiomargarita sp.]
MDTMMNKVITLIIMTGLCSLSLLTFADEPSIYIDGIWKNKTEGKNYYSIQTNANQVVMIDLSAIESSSNTLESSYIGNINDLLLSRISPTQGVTNQLYLNFTSVTDGTITTICEVCTVVPIEIEKIF